MTQNRPTKTVAENEDQFDNADAKENTPEEKYPGQSG